MNARRADGARRPLGLHDPDVLDVVEFQTALLLRRTELQMRRGNIFGELDRAAYLLLRTLDRTGPVNRTLLAAELSLDATTVGRQLASMESDGLVVRAVDPVDRRSATVALSERGERLMTEVYHRRRERTDLMIRDWDDEDQAAFGRLLTRYNDAILAFFAGSALR